MIYGLDDRNEFLEMKSRYDAMVNTLSALFNCGRWDIEELFDSRNNIEVADIVNEFVDETGSLPSWNTIYRDALAVWCGENGLVMDRDVAIHTNSCLDTSLYIREELYDEYVNELEELFNLNVDMIDWE